MESCRHSLNAKKPPFPFVGGLHQRTCFFPRLRDTSACPRQPSAGFSGGSSQGGACGRRRSMTDGGRESVPVHRVTPALIFRGRGFLCLFPGGAFTGSFSAQSGQSHRSPLLSHLHILTSCFSISGSMCSIFLLQSGPSQSTKQYLPIVVTRLIVPFPSQGSKECC